MHHMIGTKVAGQIIQEVVQPLPAVVLPLEAAAGHVLAADVFAPQDIPAFPQSSMDGYAFAFADWHPGKPLLVAGELAAGTDLQLSLEPATAVRIFTGAPVPAGADTVVMQEKTGVTDQMLTIADEQLQKGTHVRPAGSEIEAGMLALGKDSSLSPAAIGFLAGLGISQVPVYPNPVVTIIVTGNELQQPGSPLRYGQVYESNSFALRAALRNMHLPVADVQHVPDNPEALTAVLEQALAASDVVLLTGGVSVGDYDFVPAAAGRCGVLQQFHKVKQRPGKPLFFGKREGKLVFGLPGNPSSVLTCFYLYVVPALALLTRRALRLPLQEVPLARSYRKAPGLTHFLKGYYDGQSATPLDAQESYRMRSFAQANCLIQLEEADMEYTEGSTVKIHLLPR